jgi:hypothetical protein
MCHPLASSLGIICSGPLDLVYRALFEITFGSVGTGLCVSKAGFLRMRYISTESAVPAPFCYFPPLGAKPIFGGLHSEFSFLYFFGAKDTVCPLDIVVLDDVGLVEEYGAGHHVCNAHRVCDIVVMFAREIFQQQSISISWESLHGVDDERGLVKVHGIGFPQRFTQLDERRCIRHRMNIGIETKRLRL